MSGILQEDRQGAVAVLTLNAPERRNALSMELRLALRERLQALTTDAECRAIVLTGAGGTFCAGGDLTAMRRDDPAGSRARLGIVQDLVRLIAAGPRPVVAAVEGAAFGAGLGLAAAADVMVVDPEAKLSASFVKLGLMPDAGLIWSLPQRIGVARARQMMLDGRVLDGREAAAIGLADQLADAGGALDQALAAAEELARGAPLAQAQIKAAFARGIAGLEEVLAMERDGQPLMFGSADFDEGLAAFRDRRRPAFSGR
jgi:2-(1,2-epoxy-1,2-dihydrophenyl)acetyl-CoA isomerase